MKKNLLLMFALLLSVLHFQPALALTLDEAKAAGLLGEKVDGYVAAVTANPDAELRELIATTNDGRRKVYQDLAKRNQITVEAVGILSAEKLQGNAPAGVYIQTPSGKWEKK